MIGAKMVGVMSGFGYSLKLFSNNKLINILKLLVIW